MTLTEKLTQRPDLTLTLIKAIDKRVREMNHNTSGLPVHSAMAMRQLEEVVLGWVKQTEQTLPDKELKL